LMGLLIGGWNLLMGVVGKVFTFATGKSGGFFDGMVTKAVIAFTRLTFFFENLPDQAKLAFLKGGLAALTFFLDIEHFFTTKMPVYLNYLRDNWKNIFTDIGSLSTTIIRNMSSNIRATLDATWAWIKTGGLGTFKVAWTPLLDGFKETMTKLPNIPDRVLGDYELEVQSDIDRIAKNLKKGSDEAVAAALAAMKKSQVELNGATGGDQSTMNDLAQPESTGQNKGLVAPSLKFGEADTLRAIFNAQGSSLAEKQLKQGERQLKATERSESWLQQIASRTAGGELEAFA